MKYCPTCLAEFEPTTERCADCDVPLASEEEIARRPAFQRARVGDDVTEYTLAGTAEDVYEADAFAAAIAEEKIAVMVRPRRASSVGMLTSGSSRPWWDLLVPKESVEKARVALEARRVALVAEEGEAEEAAEQEAAETTGAV